MAGVASSVLSSPSASQSTTPCTAVDGSISTFLRSPAQPGSMVGSKIEWLVTVSTVLEKAEPERDFSSFWIPARIWPRP